MKKLAAALSAVTLALTAALAHPAAAQDAYPNRVIKLIVPFAAGGNTDVVGRVTAAYMQKALNVSVVVENRAGAGGITGTDAVAKAPPDGYTLCVCGVGPITVSPATEKLPYDPLKDIAPVSLINTNPLVLIVNPKLPANTAAELIALSKSKPGGLSYGTSGAGGLMHFSAEIFRVKNGANLTTVPYRGGALAAGAVVTGEVRARVRQHVGRDGATRRPRRARARHHHGQAQSAHAGHSDAAGTGPARTIRSNRGMRCLLRPAPRSRSSTSSRR